MSLYKVLPLAFFTLLFSLGCFATELDRVPQGLAADVKTAFTKERAVLLAEQKSLNSKRVRHNKKCNKPTPIMEHKCSTERLEFFKSADDLNKKISSFNKRMDSLDKNTKP